jgi:hypothetical protein
MMTDVAKQGPDAGGEMVKVHLHGPDVGDSETLWASPLGGGLYRLDNSPFFAYGVSWRDVIEAHAASVGLLEFVRCVRKSGNRTVRVFLENFRAKDAPAQAILAGLNALGCSYEGMQPRLISINVPPEIDLEKVVEFLELQSGIQWEYADPTYNQVRGLNHRPQ